MAVYVDLGLATRTEDEAHACAAYFRARTFVLNGAEITLDVHVAFGRDAWCVAVWVPGMVYGPLSRDPSLMTPESRAFVTRTFDEWLVTAPPFRAAFVGEEAYDTLLDGVGDAIDGGGFAGLFVDEATWTALGRPTEARMGAAMSLAPRTRISAVARRRAHALELDRIVWNSTREPWSIRNRVLDSLHPLRSGQPRIGPAEEHFRRRDKALGTSVPVRKRPREAMAVDIGPAGAGTSGGGRQKMHKRSGSHPGERT